MRTGYFYTLGYLFMLLLYVQMFVLDTCLWLVFNYQFVCLSALDLDFKVTVCFYDRF